MGSGLVTRDSGSRGQSGSRFDGQGLEFRALTAMGLVRAQVLGSRVKDFIIQGSGFRVQR